MIKQNSTNSKQYQQALRGYLLQVIQYVMAELNRLVTDLPDAYR